MWDKLHERYCTLFTCKAINMLNFRMFPQFSAKIKIGNQVILMYELASTPSITLRMTISITHTCTYSWAYERLPYVNISYRYTFSYLKFHVPKLIAEVLPIPSLNNHINTNLEIPHCVNKHHHKIGHNTLIWYVINKYDKGVFKRSRTNIISSSAITWL